MLKSDILYIILNLKTALLTLFLQELYKSYKIVITFRFCHIHAICNKYKKSYQFNKHK